MKFVASFFRTIFSNNCCFKPHVNVLTRFYQETASNYISNSFDSDFNYDFSEISLFSTRFTRVTWKVISFHWVSANKQNVASEIFLEIKFIRLCSCFNSEKTLQRQQLSNVHRNWKFIVCLPIELKSELCTHTSWNKLESNWTCHLKKVKFWELFSR